MTGYAVIFVGRAGGITGAAPSLQDLTAALTYVEEDREPGAEEVRFNSRNESSSLETHFSYPVTEGLHFISQRVSSFTHEPQKCPISALSLERKLKSTNGTRGFEINRFW